MTIDEVEKIYKAITNEGAPCPRYCMLPCDKCVQECKQVLEWLEELKDYRDKNKMVVRIDVENMDSVKDKIEELSKYAESQYNKAIDDAKSVILQTLDNEILVDTLHLRLEQLKEHRCQ